ncbi:hypothetical protein J3R82DRAFT_2122 [Butyriboletus roseoflavus]|nr:hypothetical protein J3R82DRAFT_2122 [Butyriboletus roseoflavus]
MQNVLMCESDQVSYALLKAITAYLQYHMDLMLDVQTETTLAVGEEQLLRFQELLKEYISLQGDDLIKNWNFQKAHLAKHVLRDIHEKGAVCNFSMCPNEKQHGPIRRAYLHQTNCKDVSKQLAKLDHRTVVCELICSWIEHLDDECHKATLDLSHLEEAKEELDDLPVVEHIYLSSLQKPTTFNDIDANEIPLPNGRSWFVPIQEGWYLKVNYKSTVDWKLATDYLRCNLSFHGNQCYDCVFICTQDKHSNTKYTFARLLMMFHYILNHDQPLLDLALVQPMDIPMGNQHTVNHDLGFTCLRSCPSVQSEFISLQSVTCGALLVPDFKHVGDFFLVNYVDGDWFFQAKLL